MGGHGAALPSQHTGRLGGRREGECNETRRDRVVSRLVVAASMLYTFAECNLFERSTP